MLRMVLLTAFSCLSSQKRQHFLFICEVLGLKYKSVVLYKARLCFISKLFSLCSHRFHSFVNTIIAEFRKTIFSDWEVLLASSP